jgi:hypothetical protein
MQGTYNENLNSTLIRHFYSKDKTCVLEKFNNPLWAKSDKPNIQVKNYMSSKERANLN